MLSLQLSDHINALLVPLAENGVLQRVTERLAAIYRKSVPLGCKQLDQTSGEQITNTFSAWRDAIASGLIEMRQIQPRHVFNAAESLEQALRAFVQAVDPGASEALSGLAQELAEFVQQYEQALQHQRNSNALPFLAVADRLAYSIATVRELLMLTRDALSEAPDDAEPNDEGRLSLILFSAQTFSSFAAKVSAVDRIYREICDVMAISPQAEPARIIKVESGSVWVDILGVPRVIKLLTDLVERAVTFVHRNYTREGRIEALPRKVEAVDAVLNLRSRLKAEGIDVSLADEAVAKATVKIASELNTLIGGEPRVEVNQRQYSVGVAVEQQFLAESRRLQIEAGELPGGENGGA